MIMTDCGEREADGIVLPQTKKSGAGRSELSLFATESGQESAERFLAGCVHSPQMKKLKCLNCGDSIQFFLHFPFFKQS